MTSRNIIGFIKKEIMLLVSLVFCIGSLFLTDINKDLFFDINWHTIATLFMLLLVLNGFKNENLFLPVIKLSSSFKSVFLLSSFFVYSVFFTSMFVTNDVSLIVFVPLAIMVFKRINKEEYIIPILVLENIAAIRGSLLTPFGSPQNLFIFTKSDMDIFSFLKTMFPLWIFSFFLLLVFLIFICRKERGVLLTNLSINIEDEWSKERRFQRILYLFLFVIVLATIVSRTRYWLYITFFVTLSLLIFDRKVFLRVDYALLFTFLCFFIFSSCVTKNEKIARYLSSTVENNEYITSIVLSQFISNVPASIVMYPFSKNVAALLYGLDSAGLVSIIGSLASVINLRLYSADYRGNSLKFIKSFEVISLSFFAIVFPLQYLLLKCV